jgi:hypothetical protein
MATLAIANSVTAVSPREGMATAFMAVQAFTRSQEGTREDSAALVTAEMLEAFPPAGIRALVAVAFMEAAPMGAAGTSG